MIFKGLKTGGNTITNQVFFDTLKIKPRMNLDEIKQRAKEKRINLRYYENGSVSIFDKKNVRYFTFDFIDWNFIR